MDDNNLTDVNFTDLDLNQVPPDPPFRSLLDVIETAHGRIEDRIRQLEGVTARARQRQRWRQEQTSTEVSYPSSGTMVDVNGDRAILDGNRTNNNVGTVERTDERGRGCKRDSSHLVAQALQMDIDVPRTVKEGGSFYDCNICLEEAKDPVLTCCGHLFCWACFYQVSYIDSTSKECPVCKGEVSDNTVIPIYGNGGSERVHESEYGLKIPPRPKARRVESARQLHRVGHGLQHVPVAEALRRIRISIGSIGRTQQQEGGSGVINSDIVSPEVQSTDAGGRRHIRIHQVSRVLSESAASLSSLSSALNSAERLVEDLESVITNRLIRNDAPPLAVNVGNGSQSNNAPRNSAPDINVILPGNSSSQSTDVSGSLMRIISMRTSSGMNLPVAPSSSSPYSLRRRSNVSRASNADNRDARETRRRRLN